MHNPFTLDATASTPVGAPAPAASLPPAVNFHLWKPCNLRCRYCFATFHDDARLQAIKGGASEDDGLLILDQLRAAGVEKVNFVGGEPTLCPHLPSLLAHSRALGFVVSIVSNGARLAAVLDEAPGCVDWVGLSVDSADERVQEELGRGRGYVTKSLATFARLHQLGIRVKLNTVVTALNWQEDMTKFVLRARPERWKVFQVLPVAGQNDGKVTPLLVSPSQFEKFVDRHRRVRHHGITMAAETNDDIIGSYAMIDPAGRFFTDVGGRHSYSPPILEVGLQAAFSAIAFHRDTFERRGGRYDWDSPFVNLTSSARRTGEPSFTTPSSKTVRTPNKERSATMAKTNPNYPSTTGKPSGGGRGSQPKSK